MSRSNYGYVGRRSGGAAWQWVVIGMVFGFGCSVVLVLLGMASGLLGLNPNSVANLPTSTPFVITATPAPVTPTIAPTEAPATATTAVQIEDIQAPTASPTLQMTFLTLQPTSQATAAATIGSASNNGSTTTNNTGGDNFARLRSIESDTAPVDGGTFEMGTDVNEIGAAVEECQQGYGGDPANCDVSWGEDAVPAHQVTVSAFNMETTEVTYEQFIEFMNSLGPNSHRNGCNGQPCMQTQNESETSNITFDGANYSVLAAINQFPVANVTWYGAKAYCEALGRRLPTEAEWEHAARGRDNTLYPWGDSWDGTLASTRRPADGSTPSPVQVFAFPGGASDFQMLNMAGNIAEWVSDWYDTRYYGRPEATIPDPTGPVSGTDKVVRGGSWDAVPFFARSVHRQNHNPLDPQAWIGFRCAEDVNAQPLNTSPLGADTLGAGGSDLPLPTTLPGGSEENTANSQPTLPPAPTTAAIPTRAGTPATLAPGG